MKAVFQLTWLLPAEALFRAQVASFSYLNQRLLLLLPPLRFCP
jgi:hypothetical protein